MVGFARKLSSFGEAALPMRSACGKPSSDRRAERPPYRNSHTFSYSNANKLLLAGAALLIIGAAPSESDGATGDNGQKTAYMLGIKCYFANGVAVSDKRYNGSGSHDDQFKASAKKSYDVIWYMGRAIGKPDALIQEDIDSYQKMMPPAFLRNDAFFQRTRYECAKIGLM